MAKKEDKKSKPESKTPELTKAKKALDAYLKENKLDPTKDWTKDKKHGKKITELVNKLNKERDKVAAAYPEKDADNNKKLVKLNKEKKEKEKSGKKEDKKEKKSAGRTATKYDYPLIDGREMTSAEKKKYRMEQRKLASGNVPKEEKEAKKAKKEKVKEKPASDKKEKKADKKKDKKKKKAAKEED